MPNWCANTIYITGPVADMVKFYETLTLPDSMGEESEFSFHQTVPHDNSYGVSLTDPFSCSNIDRWGTKGDACEPNIIKKTETEFEVQCDTAWSPPIAWAENFCSVFPKLTVRVAYCEAGLGFYGVWTYNKSENEKSSHEYKMDRERSEIIDLDKGGYTTTGVLNQFTIKYNIAHIGR